MIGCAGATRATASISSATRGASERELRGDLVGYYLPKEGANNFALALIDFPSLADYEIYRQRLAADPEAKQNFADGNASGCILVESRSFLRRA